MKKSNERKSKYKKTIEELDVETDDDAYFATMQAVNCILRGYTLEETKEFTEALNKNTLVLQRLCDKLEG